MKEKIIENLKMVDEVIGFEDDDVGSCCSALIKLKQVYEGYQIIFCNGGDRNSTNTPEQSIDGIKHVFSVGGDQKINSSSWILKDFKYEKEERIWGKFYNIFTDIGETNVKVKELIVDPGKGLSFQRHFYRNEIWFISKGSCLVNYSEGSADNVKEIKLMSQIPYILIRKHGIK